MRKIFLVIIMFFVLCGCGSNSITTTMGGTKEIDIPEGYKFVNYNIQDSDMIWCTYRPMRDDEEPEVFIVQQDKTGLHLTGNGKFVIYESKNGTRAELPKEK